MSLFSDGAKLIGRQLPALAVGRQLIGNSLVLVESTKARTFDGADVNEDILAAIVWLNESVTLVRVEPLNFTCSQNCSRFSYVSAVSGTT